MVFGKHEQGVLLRVKAAPNASRNQIAGEQDGRLIVRVTASPVDGRANKMLIKFLAKQLRIPPSAIVVLQGHTSREKTLCFTGYDEPTLRQKLQALL
jgi:uncharacterized protein (TIGR00251 family)